MRVAKVLLYKERVRIVEIQVQGIKVRGCEQVKGRESSR